MDIARASRGPDVSSLPEYIINNFVPGAKPLLAKYPRLFRLLGILAALWYFSPLARLQALWSRFSQLLISTVTVSSEEDLFSYLIAHISEQRTLRADQTLNATTNAPHEDRRRRRIDPDYEEIARKPPEEPKIKYEQSQGLQIFTHNRRLFFVKRTYGDGHTYYGNRYKRAEILKIFCLGRSPAPIKAFIESIYQINKDKERTMTVIRRPFTGGYSSRLAWSRLTAKPRRAMDTVILDPKQKAAVLKDVEEYMAESTQAFYGDHGIPYRRGYLFYGPPGCGKTSFCLAVADKFNLDVYVLTLLDHELQDSDLMSLMNQLPSPSLLLLEDIDTAGLSRKKPVAVSKSLPARGGRRGRKVDGPQGALAAALSDLGKSEKSGAADADLDSDDEGTAKASRVSLSGLLNAIDGVAAPEGHILIMTTNKPHELDDAIVRAGRISVKVAFMNASKQQAEEIFLRMYVDLPSKGSSDTVMSNTDLEKQKQKTRDEVGRYAKEFAERIPEHDFSPADLQDYLLVHKKEPQRAVSDLDAWIEQQYEERKRKEEQKEAEVVWKAEKARRRRERFREEVRVAMAGEKNLDKVEKDDEGSADNDDDDEKDTDAEGTDDDKAAAEEALEAKTNIAKQILGPKPKRRSEAKDTATT